MVGVNFWHTIRQSLRQVAQWGGGLAFLAALLMSIVSDVSVVESYADLLEAMPPEVMLMFGATDVAAISTPDGFIAFGFFAYALILMSVFAVGAGLDITASDEDEGMMDTVLSLPLARWQLVAERFAAYTVITVLIMLVSFSGFLIGTFLSPIEISLDRMFLGVLNVIPGTLTIIAITAFAATVVRRKGMALGATAGVVAASYFLDFLAESADNAALTAASKLSLFTYYDSQGVVASGLVWADVFILLTATSALFAGAVWAFQRRDVGL